MPVKPNLVVVDIDGTVNRLRSEASPSPEPGWDDDVIERIGGLSGPRVHIHRGVVDQLAQLNQRDDTEVVWLSWWSRHQVAQLNRSLDVDFRTLPVTDDRHGGKRRSLKIELLRANRERVVWLDDDEASADEQLAALSDMLTLEPDFLTGLTPLYLEAVVAYLGGADEADLIAHLVNAESWRWSDRVKPRHNYSRRMPTMFDNRGALMRKAFLEELAEIAQRAEVKPKTDESYGRRNGVRLDPWQFEYAAQLWAESGLAIEFRPLSGKPGEIQVVTPRRGGLGDGE
ncbi:HAD domain-containing protein [Microbacterium sp. ASV81]|uniref:HAD domain-containing protein n=1 Tax=Microbacterium capsulatum TaxID=3041921 RepID=A0ABU0XK50_9MICO|nr:HAD domain-containing protein [Microbacterium sp. ASV81]MDQ4214070.1 HAD domain-containing protein [Microbacterium sp. ASV81]